MKKTLTFIICIALVFAAFAACGKKDNTRMYSYRVDGDEMRTFTVMLEDSDRFQLHFPYVSSYMAIGTYEEKDGLLYLKNETDEYEFVFEQQGKCLVYRADKSNPQGEFNAVPDLALFECEK